MRKRKLESLVKRGNKYYIDYYDKQTKQRIRISTGTDLEDVAKEFRDNYFYNLKHNSQQNNNVGYINNNQEYIFDDIALKFLNDKKRTCRINTYKKYQSKMKNLAKFFTTKTLNSINKLIISNYCDYRFMNGCNQSLLREELSVLNNIFNYAVELDMMLSNPLLTFKFKKKYEDYKPRLRYLTIEEINKILNINTSNELIKIQVIILLETGLRINEAMNILFTDISIDTQTKIPFLIIRKEISKNNKEGYIPLSKLAMEQINKIKIKFPNSLFIFVKNDGTPYKTTPKKAFKNLLIEAKIKDLKGVGFHILRHTFASLKLQGLDIYGNKIKPIPIHILSKIMRHSNIRITEERYAMLSMQNILEVIE